jgi:hypothetical protein
MHFDMPSCTKEVLAGNPDITNNTATTKVRKVPLLGMGNRISYFGEQEPIEEDFEEG